MMSNLRHPLQKYSKIKKIRPPGNLVPKMYGQKWNGS